MLKVISNTKLLLCFSLVSTLFFTGCPARTGPGGSQKVPWMVRLKASFDSVDLKFFNENYITTDDPFNLKKLSDQLPIENREVPEILKVRIRRAKMRMECMWPMLTAQLERIEQVFSLISVVPSSELFSAFKEEELLFIDLRKMAEQELVFEQKEIMIQIPTECEKDEGLAETPLPEKPKKVLAPTKEALDLAQRISLKALERYKRYKSELGKDGHVKTAAILRLRDQILVLNPKLATETGLRLSMSRVMITPEGLDPQKQWAELRGIYTEAFDRFEKRNYKIHDLITRETSILNNLKENLEKQLEEAQKFTR